MLGNVGLMSDVSCCVVSCSIGSDFHIMCWMWRGRSTVRAGLG